MDGIEKSDGGPVAMVGTFARWLKNALLFVSPLLVFSLWIVSGILKKSEWADGLALVVSSGFVLVNPMIKKASRIWVRSLLLIFGFIAWIPLCLVVGTFLSLLIFDEPLGLR
jgi:hypothetical protein